MRLCLFVLTLVVATPPKDPPPTPPAHPGMPDFSKVEIKTHRIAGSVSMLEGAGGNIGVSVGPDGVFVIDDEFAPLHPKIKAALAALSKQPVRFVFNTHWHFDHTGDNEKMAGDGAIIVAQDNVRHRLSIEQMSSLMGMKIPPAPAKALPIITFSEEVTFFLNGDEIHVIHAPRAHTDGDAIVFFKKANVVHMGDVLVNGGYPIMDFDSGGTVDGYLAAQERVLGMIDDATKIIPGHGALADKAALQAAHDMLKTVRDRVAKALASRKPIDQIKAARPTAEFDAKMNMAFVKPEMLIDMIARTLPPTTGKRQAK
jgi:glyoxylase-like metal-dependent hydrolase (beta-lactamase superfamily II)